MLQAHKTFLDMASCNNKCREKSTYPLFHRMYNKIKLRSNLMQVTAAMRWNQHKISGIPAQIVFGNVSRERFMNPNVIHSGGWTKWTACGCGASLSPSWVYTTKLMRNKGNDTKLEVIGTLYSQLHRVTWFLTVYKNCFDDFLYSDGARQHRLLERHTGACGRWSRYIGVWGKTLSTLCGMNSPFHNLACNADGWGCGKEPQICMQEKRGARRPRQQKTPRPCLEGGKIH